MPEVPPRRSRRGTDFSKLRGVWRSHGYGILLEIGASCYRLHEETGVSCLRVFEGSLEELSELYVDLRISPERRSFSARRATGVTRVRYRRLKQLPRRCAEPATSAVKDPVHNFEVFWNTFSERYALFDIRGIDWPAAYEAYRPKVAATTSDERLFDTFVEMLRPLRDGHVELRAPGRRFNAGSPSSLEVRIARELGRAVGDEEVSAALLGLRERMRDNVREHYLASPTRRSGDGLLEWGRLDDATGYLAIRAMAGQSGRWDRPREDQRAVAAVLERVMADLGDLPTIVLDVRDNGGGYDGVALRIAGCFTDRKRLAFTKAASKGEHYGGRQVVCVEPRGPHRYGGRIRLLTSRSTTSAAEIFVLALLRHPRLVRIGEPTRGELSDVMERHLPNGWSMTLSNELYRASDGELYEDRGVPPHVAIPLPGRRDLESGRDPMLDHVLAESRAAG